jgi:hypothetical protein
VEAPYRFEDVGPGICERCSLERTHLVLAFHIDYWRHRFDVCYQCATWYSPTARNEFHVPEPEVWPCHLPCSDCAPVDVAVKGTFGRRPGPGLAPWAGGS